MRSRFRLRSGLARVSTLVVIAGLTGLGAVGIRLYQQPPAPVPYIHVYAPLTESSTCTPNVADLNRATVQAAIDGAADGALVCLPSGSSSAWTSGLTITRSTGFTLMGQGIGNTTINMAPDLILFDVSITSATASLMRISGMTVPGSTTSSRYYPVARLNGTCTSSPSITCSHVRFDHISTPGWNQNSNFYGYLMWADNVFGVMDNNSFPSGGIVINISHSAYGGVGENGDKSWAEADSIGTDNALYLEDNTFIGGNSESLTDADNGGGRFVGRYNTLTNGNFQTHGTESAGRYRGGRQMEVYGNNFTIEEGHGDTLAAYRSGTGVVFNNHVTTGPNGYFKHGATMAIYRIGQLFHFGYCGSDIGWYQGTPPSNDDRTLTAFASGTITATSYSWPTLTVSDTNGGHPDLSGYYDPSNTYFIVNTSLTNHPAAEITSANSTTVTGLYAYQSEAPTWNIGDTYEIRRTTYCLDQPGMGGPGDYVSGTPPSPEGKIQQTLRPIYEWGGTANTGPTEGWLAASWVNKLVENKNFYQQQASFNGTVGVGTGTWANRPGTCTNGVGYWATDKGGNWNTSGDANKGDLGTNDGALYVCASNTWTLYYTPYSYPHPLRGGS